MTRVQMMTRGDEDACTNRVTHCDPCESSPRSMARCYTTLQGRKTTEFRHTRRTNATPTFPCYRHHSRAKSSGPVHGQIRSVREAASHKAYQRAVRAPPPLRLPSGYVRRLRPRSLRHATLCQCAQVILEATRRKPF